MGTLNFTHSLSHEIGLAVFRDNFCLYCSKHTDKEIT